MKTSLRFLLLALGLFGLGVAARAQAITTTWTGANSLDFADNGNWTAGVPYFDGAHPLTIVGSIANGDTVTLSSALTFPSTGIDVVYVGGSSNTTLNVQPGGNLEAFQISIGQDAGTTGTLSLTGTVRSALGVTVGYDGTGTMTVNDGGVVKGYVHVAANSSSVGSLTLNSGASVLNDTENSNSGDISSGDGTATITLNSGSLVEGSLNLGGAGSTTLTINNGATVNGGIYFQATAGGSVSGHIDGATLSPSGILINGDGNNSLTVDNGATLSMTNLVVSDIGAYGSGANTMTVSGAGTTWTNAGQIRIGGVGTGTLNITDSAAVTQQQVTVGESSGGFGTLNINTSGSLTTDNALIGYLGGSTGQVTVDGSGSNFHVTTDFWVGDAGYGSVLVSNGGTLHNDAAANVGLSAGGSVVVTGAGSSWTSGGNVTLAANSSSAFGSITLADGGQLTINDGNGNLYLNTATHGSGTLNIGADAGSSAAAPGFLSAATVEGSSGGGNTTLVFNHTQTGSPYFFDPAITGGVFVVHKAGTTYLSGANNYSGGNFIFGGTVILGHNGALGTGDTTFAGGTIDLNGYSQTSGILAVTGNTFIDFTNNSTLAFANSSGGGWSGTLTLLDFDSNDSLRFGTDASGLLAGQLTHIDINGFIAQIDASGYITQSGTAFSAVPEPSTYAAALGAVALLASLYRRHKQLALVARN